MGDERGERFLADVMLHPFGVKVSHRFRHADRFQKFEDDLMSLARFLGETPAGLRQGNGPVRFGAHEAVAAQSLNRAVDRDMRDPQAPGQVSHPRCAGGLGEFGDEFDVVQGEFLGMFLAGAPGIPAERREARRRGLGRRAFHAAD